MSLRRADLHSHTNYSDGLLEPEDAMNYAVARTGLRVIAITRANADLLKAEIVHLLDGRLIQIVLDLTHRSGWDFANIAGHAYEGRTDGWVSVSLAFDAVSRSFSIELLDTGTPFDPSSVAAPDLEALQEGGYGLFLARSLIDDVIYTTKPDGNRWRLVKKL
jgi:hypothetical protein